MSAYIKLIHRSATPPLLPVLLAGDEHDFCKTGSVGSARQWGFRFYVLQGSAPVHATVRLQKRWVLMAKMPPTHQLHMMAIHSTPVRARKAFFFSLRQRHALRGRRAARQRVSPPMGAKSACGENFWLSLDVAADT